MLNKKSRLYRITALSVAFLFIGAAIFVPLASIGQKKPTVLWIILGVYLGLYVLTVVGNEVVIALRKREDKQNKNEHPRNQ